MHATAFLAQVEQLEPAPVVVLHGGESYLKQAALRALLRRTLGSDEGDLDCSRYPGAEIDFKTVRDELLTVSMFSAARVVVVEEADEFVSRHRAALEEYLERPARTSVLVLDVKSWPRNTRLHKKVAAAGRDIECTELVGAPLQRWLEQELQSRAGKQLTRDAAALLVELAGTSLGLLTQELDKLAAYVGERSAVTIEDVRAVVGGWRIETTWEMLDAVRDGRPALALAGLDRLLNAGEPPLKLLGGITHVFRKLAEATERARTGIPLRTALEQAGVYRHQLEAAERYLRRIGRPRAERILTLLASANLQLKGGSRIADQRQLEQLLLELAGSIPLSSGG